MSGMTSERLEELRRIAEAATPGPWEIPVANVFRVVAPKARHHNPPSGKAPPYPWAIIADADTEGTSGEQAASNMQYISAFDPPTVLALLDEIERLRRGREVLAEVLKAVHERDRHIHTCENCECALCPQGAELAYKAYRAVSKSKLLAGEEGVDGVTHFVLYDPDLNAWECQACRFWWEFEDGDPYEHDMRFCPRCGRRIVAEVRDVEDGEAEDGENDA